MSRTLGWGRMLGLAALLAIVPAGLAQAREWYVAAGARGNGSPEAPLGRIQSALDSAVAGDTVIVWAGTYDEVLLTVRDGRADGRITVRGEPVGLAVVVNAGRVLTVAHAYHTFEGLVLDGRFGEADAVKVGNGGSQLELRRVEVRNSSRDCIDIAGPTSVLVESALVHHCLNPRDGRADAHGIVAGAVRGLTIRDTEIHTFSGDGVQVDPARTASGWDDVTLEGCRVWLEPLRNAVNGFPAGMVPGENGVDTKASAEAPRARLTIRDTQFRGFRGGVVTNMSALNLKENIQATLDRITVSDSQIAFRIRGNTRKHPAGARVTLMNIVVHDVGVGLRYEEALDELHLWHATFGEDVARAFKAAGGITSVPDVRHSLFRADELPKEAREGGNLTAKASWFADARMHDYRLKAGSKPVDRVAPLDAVSTDRDGVPRPQGPRADVGAHEWCRLPCPPQPRSGPTGTGGR